MMMLKRFLFCIVMVLACTTLSFGKNEELKVIKAKQSWLIDVSRAAQERYRLWSELHEKVSRGELKYDKLTTAQKGLYEEYGEDRGFWDTGTMACSWYCGGGSYKQTASSVLSSKGGNSYTADKAHDFDLRTAWVEGKKGLGVGEYIQYHFEPLSPRVNAIEIYNGYYKSEQAWEDNARVKRLKLSINNKPYAILELANSRCVQSFSIEPVQSTVKNQDMVFRFEILAVYPGKKYDDTAISEINFDGLDVHCFTKDTLITMANRSKKSIEELRQGEKVLSYNFDTGTVESATIYGLATAVHSKMATLHFGRFRVTSTYDHPYYVQGKGWCSLEPEKSRRYQRMDQVNQLDKGDRIIFFSPEAGISKVGLERVIHFKNADPEKMYTIVKLERNHNFFANGLLVGTEELKDGQ